ncbi:MAG: ABC transporter ATP-binding protein [Erysipelotrichaceae bacterium]|nr:ABC transporter ATP-binding protein [Erysipelotrichaceae bacterium]
MLKVENIQKQYDGFALDCSLNIEKGCITGLVGRNGAGKSTLFKAILGLISIDNGNITLFDKDISDITIKDKQRIGVVFTDSGFNEYLTIKDLIPILNNLYHDFDKEYFLNQVNKFQLPLKKKIKELSNGMKAKLKIIIALSHHPDLLILDEPTAGLDIISRDEILKMLRDFMDENHIILISSHISSDLGGLCDDIYFIDQGHIILHEDTDVILSHYGLLKVTDNGYDTLDKAYIIKTKHENYGYSCLTNQKQFYIENYPDIVMENGNIDDLMFMLLRGE